MTVEVSFSSGGFADISRPDVFPGSGSFVFDGGEVAGGKPVRVHYHRPEALSNDAPIVFVMHGTRRDAKNYLGNWRAAAERFGFLLLCPELARPGYNRRAYHLGYVLHRSGKPRVRSRWTFNVIEDLFDFAKEKTANKSERYHIYGHSAGAQFVHRMAMFMPEARFQTAIAANSGWYTMPTFEVEYPYGLKDAPNSPETLRAAFGGDLVVLLGERDTDPSDPYLRNSPEVVGQGENRFVRGHNFHASAKGEAAKLGADFRWRLETAPDAQHLDAEMMPFAARALFADDERNRYRWLHEQSPSANQ